MTFPSCYIEDSNPGCCIIQRGYFNSTHCLKTEHRKITMGQESVETKTNIYTKKKQQQQNKHTNKKLKT